MAERLIDKGVPSEWKQNENVVKTIEIEEDKEGVANKKGKSGEARRSRVENKRKRRKSYPGFQSRGLVLSLFLLSLLSSP